MKNFIGSTFLRAGVHAIIFTLVTSVLLCSCGGGGGGGSSSSQDPAKPESPATDAPKSLSNKTIILNTGNGESSLFMQDETRATLLENGVLYTGNYDYDLPPGVTTAIARYSFTSANRTTVLIDGKFIYDTATSGHFVYIKTVDGVQQPEVSVPFRM